MSVLYLLSFVVVACSGATLSAPASCLPISVPSLPISASFPPIPSSSACAQAVHIDGRSSVEKHASSDHSPPNYVHDGKQHGYEAHALEIPPLLRRHDVYESTITQDHQPRDLYGDTHWGAPRSAFARGRSRQGPGFFSRRSSVYVSGEHGDTYLVSRTSSRIWSNGNAGGDYHAYNRRQLNESNLAFGRIDIMGAGQLANNTQRLASLKVDSTPIDWTSGQSTAKAFRLNASTTNQTQFIMVPIDELSDETDTFGKHVALATEVFNASSAEMVRYCATYNPDPDSKSSLVMAPCMSGTRPVAPTNNAADPCSDGFDASSSNLHLSQMFSYDPSTGKLQPISAAVGSSGTDNRCAGANVRRADGSSTTSSSTARSSTSTSTAPTPSASKLAQNVTLVYVAAALEVPALSPGIASTRGNQTAVFTTTITTTVVTTVGPTNSPGPSVPPARAAIPVSVSSGPTTPSPSASAPRSSSSSASSTPTTTDSKSPAVANGSLMVEVVGLGVSATDSTSSAASTTSASGGSVSPSSNAQTTATPTA